MRIHFLFILLGSFISVSAQDSLFTRNEIIYGRKDGMALTMIKLTPKVANRKSVISVTSGNWVSSFRMTNSAILHSKAYLERGYTVFVVMHGSQPRYAIPDQVADLKRAVRFIRYNAADYGIDSTAIGITGASSGGNLSLLVGLDDDKINESAPDPVDRVSSRVQAVAVFYPPTDFLDWGGVSVQKRKELMKRARVMAAFDFKRVNSESGLFESISDDSTSEAIAKTVSPIYSVSKDDPPVIIAHGDADPIVPISQSTSIISKLKTAGVQTEFIKKEKGSHGWTSMEVEEKRFADWFDKWLK